METNQNTQKIVLLNGFSTSMLNNPKRAIVEFRRLTPQEVREIVGNSIVENYIRHQGTTQVLTELLQRQITPNNAVYTYRGERIILVILSVPQRGQEVAVKLEDLVFYELVVHTLE
jgi:hypothetical protein